MALAVTLFVYYKLTNRRRDKRAAPAEGEVAESRAFAGLTDKENPDFRYVY